MRNNNHENLYLQRSFNKYGEISFDFIVIEYCKESELYERENYWIKYYNSHNYKYGYNNTLPSEDDRKYIHNKESKEKLSKSRTIYTNEELLSYLQEYYYHYNKVPTQRDFTKSNFPSYSVYFRNFGSFKEALTLADILTFSSKKYMFDREVYTKEDIIKKYQYFIEEKGRFPTMKEQKRSYENNLPSHNIILKHFESMENLKMELGNDDLKIVENERAQALLSLKELYDKDGFITSRTINKDRKTRSTSYYTNNFGTLINAYKLANIPTQDKRGG